MKDFAVSDDPAVQAQLDRLGALSLPQGRFGLETIREILAHAVDLAREMADADAVDVRVIADDVRLDVGRLLPLVLLLTELLANSFKHAFAPGERGRIDVRLEQAENDLLCLTVADNGKGLPASDTQPAIAGLPRSRRGLGTAIIAGLVAQLGGTHRVRSGAQNPGSARGVTTVVAFPATYAAGA